jgi:hypothetical protein
MPAVRLMLNHGLLKRIKPSNRGSCLRWLLEQGGFHDFSFTMTSNIHIFIFAAFTSSDEAMQEAAYHALCVLRFDHPLPLAMFVSILVTLGARPDVLTAAGFDVKSSNSHGTRAERESLLREWLTLVERLSRYVTFSAVLLSFV